MDQNNSPSEDNKFQFILGGIHATLSAQQNMLNEAKLEHREMDKKVDSLVTNVETIKVHLNTIPSITKDVKQLKEFRTFVRAAMITVIAIGGIIAWATNLPDRVMRGIIGQTVSSPLIPENIKFPLGNT